MSFHPFPSPRFFFLPLLSIFIFGGTACTQDTPNITEQVSSSHDSDKHAFSVDDKGLVKFKAEIVYFHFDDYTLTAEGRERLSVLSEYLRKTEKTKLKIEGHCDERGSTEYNLALGQLRAQSVRKYLLALGITENRLSTISFGEEKPARSGSDELAWKENRRAEFQFVSR